MAKDDPKRDYLLRGIKHGFHIMDPTAISESVEVDNYRSATCAQNASRVEAQIQEEVANGRYGVVPSVPTIVSALGAIEKTNGKVRLIHDCSRPEGASLNAFAWHDHFKYMSLQDAIDVMPQGAFLAKLDLSQAYRSVRIHPSNFSATSALWCQAVTGDLP